MTLDWRSKLVASQASAPAGFHSLVTPVYRGSTTLFERALDTTDTWDRKEAAYTYGLYGTPTSYELAARVCELENGRDTFLTPGGQAAIALIYLAFAGAGDHVLVPESAYGPNVGLADRVLKRFAIEVERYDPLIGSGIGALVRANTRVIWCESPGSVTMEVQDVPAIAAEARKRNVIVAIDNTYSAGVLFDAFAHGADVTMQALTKYVGGHSDVLLGSVTVREDRYYKALGDVHQLLGMGVSPDDCSLALRGLQTLAVRLDYLEASALVVAQWLSTREEIETVLHPALPSCPGYEFWARDFIGSTSVFSIVFKSGIPQHRIRAFVDELKVFKIGYSWGGVTSLVMPYNVKRTVRSYGDRLVRLNVGLEPTRDVIDDLERALSCMA
ncbi:MAG: cystathionine beta-lyase [Candidatus Eremiobacteraeota bacterium]|nr:cystathionine beta-lyase [Candidatus Eremiobacteraeota bacterium]